VRPVINASTTSRVTAPSRLLQLLELRTGWELAAGIVALPWLRLAPRGDGHPVLVLPGLVASDRSTRLMRDFLTRRGYDVHGWGLGRNYGPRGSVVQAMLATVDRLHATRGRRVSLIGQSLGGAYARWLAKQRPDAVRCVITLGSPIGGHPHASNARRIYEFTSGETAADPNRWREIAQAPPVPATAIYSRSDGIVAWQDSVEPSNAAHAESIRVLSSHVGMAVHPAVLYVLAERLAQPEGQWQPFVRRGWRAMVYPCEPPST
jgi:pimeloyl-ACP methyl ester carboxylesterase